MNDSALRYKVIAVVAVGWALYSCSGLAESDSNSSQFRELREAITALDGRLTEVNTSLQDMQGCSTADFLAGTCTDLPKDVALTTTYCIEQGRGAELSAEVKAELGAEVDLGAGWPNVVWGKVTGKANLPLGIGIVPLPTGAGGEVATHLGKGLQICAEVPIEPSAEQLVLIGDLVRGVNVPDGLQAKYRRRADRLLNYAARRTPIATTNTLVRGSSKLDAYAMAVEETDNAFDVADDAIERLLEGGLQPQARFGSVLSDPIFTDLAASLDLPAQLTTLISNPQQLLGRLQNLDGANACTSMGIDQTMRSTYPQLNNLCNSLAQLPADQLMKNMTENFSAVQSTVTTIRNSVNSLRNSVCGILGC